MGSFALNSVALIASQIAYLYESGDYFAQTFLPSACLPSGIAGQNEKKRGRFGVDLLTIKISEDLGDFVIVLGKHWANTWAK